MLSDQTRSDLEQLLAEQDVGWTAYACKSTVRSEPGDSLVFGVGGCLVEQMNRLLDAQGITRRADIDERTKRKNAMIKALGFTITNNGRAEANSLAMFTWNDTRRDPDEIRHRIKDALNGEIK